MSLRRDLRAQLQLISYFWPGQSNWVGTQHVVALESLNDARSNLWNCRSETDYEKKAESLKPGPLPMPHDDSAITLSNLELLFEKEHAAMKKVVRASEELGMASVRDWVTSSGKTPIHQGSGTPSRDEFDAFSISVDEKMLIFCEAKGGYNFGPNPKKLGDTGLYEDRVSRPKLGSRGVYVNGALERAQQGSVHYFEATVILDSRLQNWLRENPSVREALASGEMGVRYLLFHADYVGGIRIWDCDVRDHFRGIWAQRSHDDERRIKVRTERSSYVDVSALRVSRREPLMRNEGRDMEK